MHRAHPRPRSPAKHLCDCPAGGNSPRRNDPHDFPDHHRRRRLGRDLRPGDRSAVPRRGDLHDIEVFEAGQDPDGTPALEKEVKVTEGGNATVAAHLSTDGEPRMTTFTNDVSKTDAGQARLTVRHVAAAPAVDVRAGGQPLFTDLANPDEDTASVDAGTVNADVVVAGTDTVAIGPAELDLKEGVTNVVYAWGSAEDKNLALTGQTVSSRESTPHTVHPGGSGAAAVPDSSDQWAVWAAAPERSR
ncbi:DUF4397 domain-containing protein [Streptomyces sp. IBSBF 2507]|uniref:DUF4397 domain-containing protein n=1 Tax=Streptomyces sp. IBSBF 2507 TaxID=2903530 RepID=UPI00351F6E44